MAKILVADDNSNIQKMVGLALKDQGIDVVAVGNGEAAVRKISDVKPDLVLADVFMPVRNGYEVCKYVKDDSTLAHIPVILLVGAFDPLDEQEAQRVGADGVLKKPFVPPDPLISMVKSALARAGVSYSSAGPDKSSPADTAKLPEVPAMPAPTLPTLTSFTPSAEPSISVSDSESFVDEAPSRPEPVRINSASQPLAFGSMLETPATKEEQEDDMPFVTPSNSGLVPERDWNMGKAKEEDEDDEEEEPSHSWRRDGGDTSYAARETTGNSRDWREAAFPDSPARRGHDGWQPSKEKTGFVEAAEAEAQVAAVATEAPAPPAPVSEPSVVPSLVAPAASFEGDAWAKAIAAGSDEKSFVEEVKPAVVEAVQEVEVKAAVEPVVETPAPVVAEPEPTPVAKSSGDSWFSTASSPWDAVAQKANQLASSWDSAVAKDAAPVPVVAEKPVEPVVASAVVETPVDSPAETENIATESSTPAPAPIESAPEPVKEAELPPAAAEAIREDVSHYSAENVISETPDTDASKSTDAKDAGPKTESQDDLVAKVLAKMSPEMLQAVTREILKPVVAAMVKEELESKKK